VRCAEGWRGGGQQRQWRDELHTVYLILDLSEKTFDNEAWVATSDIAGISGRLRVMYSGMTPKAISRDINALVDVGLLRHTRGKVRPRFEVIEAYRPRQVKH